MSDYERGKRSEIRDVLNMAISWLGQLERRLQSDASNSPDVDVRRDARIDIKRLGDLQKRIGSILRE